MRADRHLLIVGAGSVGKRHARNFAGLGCRMSCVDPRESRRAELAAETPVVASYETADEALAPGGLDGVVIASPTAYHARDTMAALGAGLPVLLEKPAARTTAEAQAMLEAERRTRGRLLLGYTWRWWPPLLRVRELLREGAVGQLRHVQFHMSAHLADWHPWERYQDFFMASAAQGGGALLDESHWIDLMLWLFGPPLALHGRVETISALEIDSDDNVDALLDYPAGLRVSLHLDLFGRPHEKFIRFVGEDGTLLWSAEPNRLAIGREPAQVWHEERFECERNDMFLGVARDFLRLIDGSAAPSCTLADGARVMTVIEAIRTSSAEGRKVVVGGAP
jgi:predicted dehydrogenase